MYLYSWPSREFCESSTQLPKMLTYLAIVFITLCLDSMLPSLTPNWTICSALTASLLRTDHFGISRLTLSILLFRFRRFLRAQFFVWSSRQSRQKKVSWTRRCRFKDAGDKIPSLATHPRTHTKTHTYTSINIYECSLLLSGWGYTYFRACVYCPSCQRHPGDCYFLHLFIYLFHFVFIFLKYFWRVFIIQSPYIARVYTVYDIKYSYRIISCLEVHCTFIIIFLCCCF